MPSVLPRYNPYARPSFTPQVFQLALRTVSNTNDPASFQQWLQNFRRQHGSDWAQELVDLVLSVIPGGASVTESMRNMLVSNLYAAGIGTDVAAIASGQSAFGGSLKSDLDRYADALALPFQTGGTTNFATATGLVSNNPIALLASLGSQYAAAKARNDQDTMDTLRDSASFLANQLAGYFGGNAGRNFARRIRLAAARGHFWEDLNQILDGVPGWTSINFADPEVDQPDSSPGTGSGAGPGSGSGNNEDHAPGSGAGSGTGGGSGSDPGYRTPPTIRHDEPVLNWVPLMLSEAQRQADEINRGAAQPGSNIGKVGIGPGDYRYHMLSAQPDAQGIKWVDPDQLAKLDQNPGHIGLGGVNRPRRPDF